MLHNKSITTLHDLLLNDMTDIYTAERLLLQALPLMASMATSEQLRHAMQTHLIQTEHHVERLQAAFELLNAPAMVKTCPGMAGLIQEGKELGEKDIDREALDAALIASAQRVEHYEIAAYGTMVEYARVLGLHEVHRLLEETLAEEKATDLILSALAEGGINLLAERGFNAMPERGAVTSDYAQTR